MSDLESRLRSDLPAVGNAIGVPYGDVATVIKRGRVRKMMANLATVAAVLVVAGGAWQLTRVTNDAPVIAPPAPTTSTTTPPDTGTVTIPEGLEGKPYGDVLAALNAIGLQADLYGEYSDTVPPALVIGIDPGPGTRLVTGDMVAIHFSQGPESPPDLLVHPASGLPGDPLSVCGTTSGALRVWIVMIDTVTEDTWPFRTSVGPDQETGDWCWEGTIPAGLETKTGANAGQVHAIDPGTYELRAEVEAIATGRGTLEVVALPSSQSPEDAARDGVLPTVAALSLDQRVNIYEEVDTSEGRWVLSSISPDVPYLLGDCDPSDTNCVYGRDFISTGEYGEVLLLSESGQKILHAYPLPGFPVVYRDSMLVTDDAIYCSSQGDGGLPDSMLCRIDRTTFDWIVRVFPSFIDSGFGVDSTDRYIPDNWTIDKPVNDAMFLGLKETPDGLVTEGYLADYVINPMTLELTRVPVSGPATTTDPAG